MVNNLLKIYGAQKAVNDISFALSKGEIVGFLGPNGAGKSTTMKIITGYLQQDAGTVSVCGIDVSKDPIEAKRKIGYLPESNPLYHEMYVKEYLSFVAGVHKIENRKSKIDNVIALTGLTLEKAKKIGQLSKGYKQRVGLAAALIHEPEVLVLDEPTSGLDPNQIIEIRNVIKEQGKNKTVLFSSHIMQEVQAICDRVIIINKGRLVADDSMANLLGKKQTNEVVLVLKEEVSSTIFGSIQSIQQVNANTWHFNTTNPEQLKKQLMGISLDQNLNIISINSAASDNLEEIFRTLTNVAGEK